MGIEDVIERRTIEFPRPLGVADTEKLLIDVAQALSYRLRWHVDQQKTVGDYIDVNKYSIELGSASVSGSYAVRGKATESFRCEADQEGTQFAGIRFELVPGWRLSEYRPEAVAIWDAVREQVTKSFPKE